ncbi:N5-carboxyaminoimidazole ribonucleotide synthase [Blastomonas marina]|uniref:N5-carboxyaminoimidazole ribonucleotide synthase n=1 Tax=Blastomonas marina TaxID=1867408 RepID=A0ABQ1FHW5_9SPHN|nr:N5-carboxyaminoimidazole ribonucleotide synthase [Blastomonas marina]
MSDHSVIPPGSTIGILGGGQLGKMLATAAAQLGYRVEIYSPEPDSIAADVAAHSTVAAWDDIEALERFARECSVVTYEFENVPVAPLAAIKDMVLRPGLRALEVAQDRLAEKRFAEDHGGRPAPFAPVANAGELETAMKSIGTPGILKTCREGYDGKGQWRTGNGGASDDDLAAIAFPETGCIYEGFVEFESEFSVIACRALDGSIAFYDSAENDHEGGILSRSTVPASMAIVAQVEEARELTRQIADALDYVGVLTIEFFATANGPVFNEMAPRVHNSGHWTIEGAVTSQFENHIRAICGLPLGDTALAGKRVVMDNLIGEAADGWVEILADPQAALHLYGKGQVREGRKMGHVTRVERT